MGRLGTLFLMSQRNQVTQWKHMSVLVTFSATCREGVYFGSWFEEIAVEIAWQQERKVTLQPQSGSREHIGSGVAP